MPEVTFPEHWRVSPYAHEEPVRQVDVDRASRAEAAFRACGLEPEVRVCDGYVLVDVLRNRADICTGGDEWDVWGSVWEPEREAMPFSWRIPPEEIEAQARSIARWVREVRK